MESQSTGTLGRYDNQGRGSMLSNSKEMVIIFQIQHRYQSLGITKQPMIRSKPKLSITGRTRLLRQNGRIRTYKEQMSK
jgi:hypothetical protein